MAAPIVVDIASGPAVSGELAAILVEACSRAAGGGGCVLGDPKRTGGSIRALAVVWLDGPDHRRLRVDVASLGSPDGALHSRELEFRDEDPLPDRYRTAGLTVAAMAAARAGAPAPPAGADPGRTAGEAPPRPVGWFAGAGGLAGSGLEGGPARIGGWIMAAVLDPRSGFFGTLSASYAAAATRDPAPGLSVQWLTLGGGGGLAAPIEPLDVLVRTRIEAVAGWTRAAARDEAEPTDPAPAKPMDPARPPEPAKTAQSWGLGARGAVDLVWPADAAVALVGGAEAFLQIHGTNFRVHLKPEPKLPLGGFTGTLGVQLRLH
ncbi:hypothetical protein SOCE26_018550 [Sorangium cellulosum]|uniref:Uncharacterized protein n=1 Tax=Sorangium cellulosum TaxID=56 RepID=A0A2L0EMC9_SORCE|nr:hypothetical protein [Sorangium cellulosum]AUX40454.1 hypothetical protein SOCE26_018550 [Sorangium cellulosum]